MSVPVGGAPAAARDAAERTGTPVFTQVLSDVEVAYFADRATDGPLAGMPFVVKDNLDLAGRPTTAACPLLEAGPVAAESAVAVRRLSENRSCSWLTFSGPPPISIRSLI